MVDTSTSGDSDLFLRLTENVSAIGEDNLVWSVIKGVEHTVKNVEGEGKVAKKMVLKNDIIVRYFLVKD